MRDPFSELDFLSGGGEAGALMRALDWSKTPIGPAETWSPSLKMMVSLLLANRFPLLLWWGPQYISIYNDAYSPILGPRHPRAMGLPFAECWPEVQDVLRPLVDTPFQGGPATWMEDIPLELHRYGFPEETHFTIAYSPVPDDTAPRGIGGVLATVHEITEKVVAERRVGALRDLGARIGEARTVDEACAIAAEILAQHPKDVPFALLYLIEPDGAQARLAGSAGLEPGSPAAPRWLELRDSTKEPPWPVAEVLGSDVALTVEDLPRRFAALPKGPWADPPTSAVILPVRSHMTHHLSGFFVAGVSSRLRFDDQYRSFFELAATQIATAVTNARAYEEERKRAEALAEIDRAKTVFFSNVSHEFRTPLTLMLGPLEDMLGEPRDALSPPETRAQLAVMHRNGLRLLKLVNTLLDFSRIEAGRIRATYEPVDLASSTAELASNFRSACEKAGLTLTVECPALDEEVFVDRDMWEKIVLNLLSNAFKFTLKGTIAVGLSREEDRVLLKVRDTGCGVPEWEMPRLFERFHRVEGTRGRTHEGTGIGLALVQELVKLHRGSVRAESRVGEGSIFTVSIPLGSAHLPQDRIRAPSPSAAMLLGARPYVEEALRWLPDYDALAVDGTGGALAGLDDAALALQTGPDRRAAILVADDNADMRDYLRGLLSPRYEVRAVSDGAAALAAIRESCPDLVLSDVMMPSLDGFGLIRAIRADPALRDLPVILLSARAGEESSIEGLEAGADDYLVKPFSARELLARVRANLDMARLRREAESALRDVQEQLQSIFDNAPFGIYLIDSDFRIRQVNPVARPTFGRIPDLIGRDFDEVIHILWPQHYADEVSGLFRRTLETGEPYFAPERVETRLDLGITEYYEWRISRIRLPEGRYGVVCYFRDISVQILARQSLAAAQDRLRELNESLEREVTLRTQALEAEMLERQKAEQALQMSQRMEAIGRLTGGVAHDFNNILTVVAGQTELVLNAAGQSDAVRRSVAAMRRVADRGARLTAQLLAFSRSQNLRPSTVALNQLMTNVDDLLRRAAGETIRLEFKTAGDLWQALVDPAQFESALLNLVINARDAMPDGGTVTIDARNVDVAGAEAARLDLAPGSYVVVSVADTGSGMSAEVREHAFEPFFTTKDIGKGTGLGLAQIYGFAKQSGGAATIESTLGKGTIVSLYLPRTEAPAIAEAPTPVGAPQRGKGGSILVVEDQPDVRDLIETLLSSLGYRVLTAPDSLAARSVLKGDEPIDLLLSDVVMPRGVSGLDLAEEARRLRQDMKIILMSGYARDLQGGRVPREFAFLEKPFRAADLATAIDKALAGNRRNGK